ncbi:aminoglycoside phosphotransferase family protein, partial [Streptomyces sp. G35A]
EAGPDDERRGRAVTVWLLEQAAPAGHTALEMSALVAALGRQGVPDPEGAVQSAIAEGDVLVFQDAVAQAGAPAPRGDAEEAEEADAERPVRVLVGLERYALAEESLADGLARLVNSVPEQGGPAGEWERAAASAGGSAGELIRAVAGHGLVLHTGGEASLAEPAALLQSELAYQNHVAASSAYAALPRGPIHADLFRDNVMFEGEELTGLFDFYFAGVDTFLFDLAVCLNDWCIDLPTGAHAAPRAQAMIDAYQAVRPLTAHERALLPAMLRAGALRFWISRLWDF